jgi:hypothetical protein
LAALPPTIVAEVRDMRTRSREGSGMTRLWPGIAVLAVVLSACQVRQEIRFNPMGREP